jgi:hypothetical protein
MDEKKEQSQDEVTSENQPKATITRRESLKKIAVTAYAAPATMVLLTSKRAVAQSEPCACELSGIGINVNANTFSATRSWFNCPNIDQHRLRIYGGRVDLEYSTINVSEPTGSQVMTDISPYNLSVFQNNETYNFTLGLIDSSNNVFRICSETYTTPPP